jgi:Polysulphide reductase, NrfD
MRRSAALNGYYGYPMIKPPEWTDLIPTYFFVGGMAGTAATIASAERCAKNDELAGTMILGAAAGSAVSAFCLIADLKRPERFINMLRVFKPTSPMSMGVYIFSAFSGATFIAAAAELTGVLRPIGRVFEVVAALLGPAMSTYTAVLIGDTVVPAWQYGRRTLPLLFAATSASTAAGWGLVFGNGNAGTPRRLASIAGPAVLFTLQRLHHELGPRQKGAYETGEAALYSKAAKVLNTAGTIAAIASTKSSALAKLAGALLLAGGLSERFGVFRAGCNSARDPSYTIDAQAAAT